MPCPEKPFYNNDLWLAERAGFEPSVCQSITLHKSLNSLINSGWSTFPRTRDSRLNPEHNDLRLSTDWAICICSLIATAKLNDIEPYAYLKDVLERMTHGHPANRIDDLLPWNWKASNVET